MEQSRLHELENQCIQDCAPPCTASCPLHVDIRKMMAAVGVWDFSGGYDVLRKVVPFPEILSRTCDQPCQNHCNRESLGGVIRVADLERACVEFADTPERKMPPIPKKKAWVAVIGGGLSGLTVAYDLARKGYGVDLFEQRERVGGNLLAIPEWQLPHYIREKEIGQLTKLGVRIHLNAKIQADDLRIAGADALYLGSGKPIEGYPNSVDPLTFQTADPRIFAGGTLLHSFSPVRSISDGRRAAISIDRLLQKVSLGAARANEGSYKTSLFTNLSGLAVVEPHVGPLTHESAITEARRCLQCECMECVKSCEYLRDYGEYPRKYIRKIYNNLSMLVRSRTANQFINSCSLCGLCGEICPTGLDMGQVNYKSRHEMVETGKMPESAHQFALRDMEFSNGEKAALARPAPTLDSCSYIFFPGCQLSGSKPDHVEKAYAFLREKLPAVGLMLRCCGAPADWAGRRDIFSASQVEFRAEHETLGKPKVILACSSCYQMFQRHYPDVEILSFWNLFDQLGTVPHRQFSEPITIHDPCSTRYESQIQDSVRNILSKLGGKIQELPNNREKTECCSFGGLMWFANRPLAEKVIQKRISESPLDYVTYCAMCRDIFARQGKRTSHLLDLIFDGPMETSYVGFSQRHENRARLKAKLLRELWGESVPGMASYEAIRLVLSDETQHTIEDRLILVEDIQRVIEYAKMNGKQMFNPTTGHYLASRKPASVTYWVEYTSQADGAFFIHKAYSHRIEVGAPT